MSEIMARELSEAAELGDAVLAHLHDNPRVPVFLDRLVGAGRYVDAIKIWGRWLPLPLAIWWACLCVWHRVRPRPHEVEDAALGSVLQWLKDPTDETGVPARGGREVQTDVHAWRHRPCGVLSSGSVCWPQPAFVAALPGLAPSAAPPPSLPWRGEENACDAYRLFIDLLRMF